MASPSRLVRVAVTGAAGFVAQHLLKRLHEHANDFVSEVVTIDRKPLGAVNYLNYQKTIPTKHFECDLTDSAALTPLLAGIDVVFHLAHKRLELLLSPASEATANAAYLKDNIEATECLVEAMLKESVPYLVFLGDAFANLEPEDNFGLSEDIHVGVPRNFLTGCYGESRTRAELFVRSQVGAELADGRRLHVTCPRAVLVYGEGDDNLLQALIAVARSNGGQVPVFDGCSRGMFQFIYAGNLAGILESAMRTLISQPERCNGEFFYCMDESKCSKLCEFFEPILAACGYSFAPPSNYLLTLGKAALMHLKERVLGVGDARPSQFSWTALRFLFSYAYGFAYRKQLMITDFRPTESVQKAVARTAYWARYTFTDMAMPQPQFKAASETETQLESSLPPTQSSAAVIPVAVQSTKELEGERRDNVLKMG